MTFSSLISGTIPNHGKYNARPGGVTRVIQHHWAGTTGGIERLSNPTQKASATYLVLSDGQILGQVPEEFRPWTSGGPTADNPSITIECQNSIGAPDYKVSDAAYNSIVRLIADIAKRHGFSALDGNTYRGHREFAATACPGPYLWPRLQSIRDAANALSGGTILVGSHGGVPHPVNVPAPTIPALPTVQEDDMLTLILWCYTNLVGRTTPPRTDEVAGWITATAGKTSAQVLNSFLNAKAEPGSVTRAYTDYLHRAAASGEVAGWVAGGLTIKAVRAKIAASPEALARK